jgi:hypothetical protein
MKYKKLKKKYESEEKRHERVEEKEEARHERKHDKEQKEAFKAGCQKPKGK